MSNDVVRSARDHGDGAAVDDISYRPEVEGHTATPLTGGNIRKADKDVAHRTVIYFGDTNQRQNSRLGYKEASSQFKAKDESKMMDPEREEKLEDSEDGRSGEKGQNERQRSTVGSAENEDVKVTHEIVVNVSPSREDVLRIEEDESQVEDYWSLPGDNSGFKADWSFVQQWRLRG